MRGNLTSLFLVVETVEKLYTLIMKHKISFCIACKDRSFQKVHWDGHFRDEYFPEIPKGEYTLRLLPNCLNSIRRSKPEDVDFEVIISDFSSTDTDYDDWVGETLGGIGFKVLSFSGAFSKGKGLNAAASAATGDILFFIDTDMLVSSELIEQAIGAVENEKAFFPICKSYKDPLHVYSWLRETGFGNLIISKETFCAYGEWIERESYGLEDDEMWHRLSGIACRKEGIGFFHQWHPVGNKKASFGGSFSRKNDRYDLSKGRRSTKMIELNLKSWKSPLVSVVFHADGSERYVEEILQCIGDQSYRRFEIIVVAREGLEWRNNAHPMRERVRIRKIEEDNVASAFNDGLTDSNGDYLVLMGSGEYLLPDALESNLEYFRKYPECALSAGRAGGIEGTEGDETRNKDDSALYENDIYIRLLRENCLGPLCSVMFKREVFEMVGTLDEELFQYFDYDIFLRIAKKFPVIQHEKKVSEIPDCVVDAESGGVRRDREIDRIYNKQLYGSKNTSTWIWLNHAELLMRRMYARLRGKAKSGPYEREVRRALRDGRKNHKGVHWKVR